MEPEEFMKRICVTLLVLLGMLTHGRVGLAKDHPFVQGVLLDATVDERVKKGSTAARAVYVVQVEDLVYTVQGEAVKTGTKDYTKGLIVGDPVEVSVDGEHLFLRRPNGKEIKTDVLKRARASHP